jgi:hypothetical protein
MGASVRTVDFRKINDDRTPLPHRPRRHKNGTIMSMTKKQLRERARRSKDKGYSVDAEILYKPIHEWDAEELARGRPRSENGSFNGQVPKWLTRELHEESLTRFRQMIRDGLQDNTRIAIETIKYIMENDDLDAKGRPVVAASTKLEAAKYLVDHTLGKPKQRIETDISVRMQGMLATAIITPGTLPALPGSRELASPRGDYTDADSWEEDD